MTTKQTMGTSAAAVLCALLAWTGTPSSLGSAEAAKLTKTQRMNATLFRNASFRVRVGMNEPVVRAKLWIKVSGTAASNLQVKLRSPAGKVIVVHNRGGGSADTLDLEVPASELAGVMTGGQWTLVVDDQTLDIKMLGKLSKARLLAWQLDLFYKGNDKNPGVGPGGPGAPGGAPPAQVRPSSAAQPAPAAQTKG